MIYLELFWSFFQIGLFSFGGGYAAMPLIRHQVVELHPWLTMTQFSDIITISQMTPGPIAVNSATFVGIRIAGFPGAIVATLGCIAPACVIATFLAFIYYRYRSLSTIQGILGSLRPAVVALIGGAGLSLLISSFWPSGISLSETDWIAVLIFLLSFIVLRWKKPNPIIIMAGAGAAAVILYPLLGHFIA